LFILSSLLPLIVIISKKAAFVKKNRKKKAQGNQALIKKGQFLVGPWPLKNGVFLIDYSIMD